MQKLVALALGSFLLLGGGFYIYSNRQDFGPVLALDLASIVVLLGVALVYAIIQGMLYNSVLKFMSIRMSQVESFGALMLTLFGNYFFPFAGFGARGVYLYRAYGLSAKLYSLSVVAIVLVELTMYASFGVLAVAYLLPLSKIEVLLLFAFFVCAVIGGVWLIFFKLPLLHRVRRLENLSRILDEWYEFRDTTNLRPRLAFYTCLQFLGYSALFGVAFTVLSIDITVAEAMLHSALSDFGFVFKVAPAGLGTYEALVVFSANLTGKTASEAIMVLVLVRFAMLFWPMVLTPFFSSTFTSKAQVGSLRELTNG